MRALLYDWLIVPVTARWYRAVLERLPRGTSVLDVGIGTAGALVACADLVVAEELRITGVDVDVDYVRRARRRVRSAGLSDRIEVRLESVAGHQGGPYDAVYFSGSFMLLPDPAGLLAHVAGLLAPEGVVYFTQTFQERRSRLAERIKPLLKWLTTIDFGRVTYEEEFLATLDGAGVAVVENLLLRSSRSHSFRLIAARRRPAAEAL